MPSEHKHYILEYWVQSLHTWLRIKTPLEQRDIANFIADNTQTQNLFHILSIGNDNSKQCVLWLLVEFVYYDNKSTLDALEQLNAFEMLEKHVKTCSKNKKEVMMLISNLLVTPTEPACQTRFLEEMISHKELVQDCLQTLETGTQDLKQEALIVFQNVLQNIKRTQDKKEWTEQALGYFVKEMHLFKNIQVSLLEEYEQTQAHLVLSALEVILTALAIAEKLDSFEVFYKEFEQSGCIDGVENC